MNDAAPLSPLGGLSPADLLRQGAAEDTLGSTTPFQPPSLEEVAALFPQFEVLELIGQGGMGAVYKVRQKELDRVVALKILPRAISETPGFSDRFAREARALAKLNHPGIVTLHEFGQTHGLYFIVMEYVDGVNLRQLMQNDRISPREALAIVPQICDALQFAHDHGIVHRDIKPENVLLDRLGRVKVADFGIAKVVAACELPTGKDAQTLSPDLTLAGKILGTPPYMAPEQFERPGEVDHRADIYALGVVLYQMLTGELPDKELQPPSKKIHLDVRLDEVVLQALEKNPAMRFQQASVMKTRLENYDAGDQRPALASSYRNLDYRSKRTLFGLPLLHVTAGQDPATGRERVAKGILAIGGRAKGVVAVGGIATGGFAIGGISTGVIAFGGLACGLISFGGLALGFGLALGGLAFGPVAMGGEAIGWWSYGGQSLGPHALGPDSQDPDAVAFFMPWATRLLTNLGWVSALLVLLTMGLGRIPAFLVRRQNNPPGHKSKPRLGWLVAQFFTGVLAAVLTIAGIRWLAPRPVSPTPTKKTVAAAPTIAPPVPAQPAVVTLPTGAPTALAKPKEETPAEKSAIALPWLEGIDQGDYGRSYRESSAYFKTALTESQWIAALERYRKPLGALVSRHATKTENLKDSPVMPKGEHRVMVFESDFAEKHIAVETVTFTKDEDGVFRASGYFIR